MDVSQEQVDDLVSFLKKCSPKCWYTLLAGRVLITSLIPMEPFEGEPQLTPHEQPVLDEAIKQGKLKKLKWSEMGIVSSDKQLHGDYDCYVLAEGS